MKPNSNSNNNDNDVPMQTNDTSGADPTKGPTYNHHHQEEEKKKDALAMMANNNNNKDKIEIVSIEPYQGKEASIRANAFVSKQSTQDLADYVVEEYWGKGNLLLFKYLDYIFRCQMFDNQVKKVTYSNGDEITVFHSGLQRREDYEFLFLILRKNEQEKKQKWRMTEGNIVGSCVSIQGLTGQYLLNADDVPNRCKFYKSSQELIFDTACSIEVDLSTILGTNGYKRRIFEELSIKTSVSMASDVEDAFNAALVKSMHIIKVNPRLTVPQLFIGTEHKKTDVQLLLPLIIEYPQKSDKKYMFALTLEKEKNGNKYAATDLLTRSMAYTNARLLGYVDSSWLVVDPGCF